MLKQTPTDLFNMPKDHKWDNSWKNVHLAKKTLLSSTLSSLSERPKLMTFKDPWGNGPIPQMDQSGEGVVVETMYTILLQKGKKYFA